MSKYAQGEATIKEVRNAEFLASLTSEQPKSKTKSKKKSKKE